MDDDLRILVLGDENNPEDLIEYELSKSNLRFIMLRVTSREAFLHALQESSPNLILVATGTPGIGSLTALALAQEICPGTPCFLISPTGLPESVPGNREDQVAGVGRRVHNLDLRPTISSFFTAVGITPPDSDETEVTCKTQDALQPFLQVTSVIIVFLSPEARILEFNRGAERLTGWRRHEILGQDCIALFFPEANRVSALTHLQRVLSGKSAEGVDLPLRVRSGLTFSYRWYCNLVSDRQGQPAGIMLVGQHISESKPWVSQLRARLARCCPHPVVTRGRGLLTRRTGTC